MGTLADGGNSLYLTVSCGYLQNKKKEIKTRGYEGTFVSIKKEEDEFEGKKIDRVKLTMKDEKTGETAIIQFTADSWFAVGFFCRVEKLNLDKPFVLGVSQSDQNEKISFCWMKQGGNKVDKDPAFPTPVKVKVGKSEVVNWEPVTEICDVIMEEMNKSGLDVTPSPQRTDTSARDKIVADSKEANSRNDTPDDLPFILTIPLLPLIGIATTALAVISQI